MPISGVTASNPSKLMGMQFKTGQRWIAVSNVERCGVKDFAASSSLIAF